MRARRRAFGGGVLAIGVGLLVALPTAAWSAGSPGCMTGLVTWTATTSSTGRSAGPIPSATYTGKGSDGATVTLTVSSDGTLVNSYHIIGILGKDANGATCQATVAEVQNSLWPGAPITGGSFQDGTIANFSFGGTFSGPQSVSGSFNLNDPPDPTDSTGGGPSPGGGGSTGGGGPAGGTDGSGSTGSNGGTKHKQTIRVRVRFGRTTARMLAGTVKPVTNSTSKACTAHRAVILWSGRKQLRHARTTAKGAFKFKVTNAMWRRKVHAGVRSLMTSTVTCTSANSVAVRIKRPASAGAAKKA